MILILIPRVVLITLVVIRTMIPIMTQVLIWLVDSIFRTSFGSLVVGQTHDRCYFNMLNILSMIYLVEYPAKLWTKENGRLAICYAKWCM